MTYSACDYMDSIGAALGTDDGADDDSDSSPEEQAADRALAEIARLQAAARLPMPDSAYIVAYGNVVDGFGFTGPFAGRDEASAWADRHGRHLDGDWSIVPLALPEA